MTEGDEPAFVTQCVLEFLKAGLIQVPPGAPTQLGQPLAVQHPEGGVHSWIVPFLTGTRLLGWAQVSRSLDLLRFSLLPRGRMELDPAHIAERIPGALLSGPVLTYDRDPSRLVWRAESRTADGAIRRWLAAGESVWEDTGEDGVTGGPPR